VSRFLRQNRNISRNGTHDHNGTFDRTQDPSLHMETYDAFHSFLGNIGPAPDLYSLPYPGVLAAGGL
jgi:hypothetical protein